MQLEYYTRNPECWPPFPMLPKFRPLPWTCGSGADASFSFQHLLLVKFVVSTFHNCQGRCCLVIKHRFISNTSLETVSRGKTRFLGSHRCRENNLLYLLLASIQCNVFSCVVHEYSGTVKTEVTCTSFKSMFFGESDHYYF